ncbi:hypothetical protein SUGI_0734080 [Cryptomeria japonica]|uniref:uncharacterized protein LOC131062317 n=1 Tax=Cryptomeria japonica TaxID=3369 RepID=UPI0024149FD2|nr:uncharacterized protein LOC131062317 [Cryptomeria japonica]GLJ36535.1 hypothetical protein SUGI_0734080 [Cryptomeria japonica]
MDHRHSEVSVPLYPSRGIFTVDSINGVTTISLHHYPVLSSTMETGGIQRPGVNSNCISAVPASNHVPISRQREPSSDSKGGCSSCQRNELNLEELLNFERDLIRRGLHLTQQYPQQISQQGIAFMETHNQVLQLKSGKRSTQILQPESSKKLKQDNSKSPNSQLRESSGWCSLCQIDCQKEIVLKHHMLGKKHRQLLNKLKEGEIIGNVEENEKQVKEGDAPQKKRKRSSNTNQQTVKCNTCDKVFITQDSFESHIAGKKHVKQLKIMESSKVSSKVKDDSKKCAGADGNELISTESGLLAEDDMKKRAKYKHSGKAKDDSDSGAINDKFDMKANTELKDQQQMKEVDMSSNKHKILTNVSNFSKKECKICDVLLYRQADFESHFNGRKHAKMLKISEISKSSLESKGDGKECAKVDGKESGGSDFGLLTNDSVGKTIEDKAILELKDDGDLRANSDKAVQRDDAEIMEIDGENIDVPNGEENKLEVEVRNDKDVQRENAEIKEIVGENVDVPDGEDNKIEVEVRNDSDVQRENADIKEIVGGNVDVPDGEDNKLEVEVRNVKENAETDNFDGKKDIKMDIKEFAITGLKESEASDDGPLVKDNVDKTAEDTTILEVKDDGCSEAQCER